MKHQVFVGHLMGMATATLCYWRYPAREMWFPAVLGVAIGSAFGFSVEAFLNWRRHATGRRLP